MKLDFFVDGRPAPQGSKRHVGGGRMIESSKALPGWRRHIADIATRQAANAHPWLPIINRPVAVELWFILPRPIRLKGSVPHIKRPDVDKLARAVLDAITGIVLADDSLVTELYARKRHAEPDETTGVHIRIETRSSPC
jgi:crossover junction endodeoxyribonuclease RusA